MAEALLDGRADIEARDRAGETPLRRAVNCGKTDIAALLLVRGADIRSVDRRGIPVWNAVRGAAMKAVVERYVAS